MSINPLFDLGKVVSTQGALAKVNGEDMLTCLNRHQCGDWGDLEQEDKEANDLALVSDEDRMFSMYHDRNGIKFYIITEGNRSYTVALLPEEY